MIMKKYLSSLNLYFWLTFMECLDLRKNIAHNVFKINFICFFLFKETFKNALKDSNYLQIFASLFIVLIFLWNMCQVLYRPFKHILVYSINVQHIKFKNWMLFTVTILVYSILNLNNECYSLSSIKIYKY